MRRRKKKRERAFKFFNKKKKKKKFTAVGNGYSRACPNYVACEYRVNPLDRSTLEPSPCFSRLYLVYSFLSINILYRGNISLARALYQLLFNLVLSLLPLFPETAEHPHNQLVNGPNHNEGQETNCERDGDDPK